jgi:hypothetical protein
MGVTETLRSCVHPHMVIESAGTPKQLLALQVWADVRPYIRCIAGDFLVCAATWVGLWLLARMEQILRVPGWPSDLMPTVHGISAVALTSTFVGFLIYDVYTMLRAKGPK